MQNDDDDYTDDGLIDRTVAVDLLSCYLKFKYAVSILFTYVMFLFPRSMTFTVFLKPSCNVSGEWQLGNFHLTALRVVTQLFKIHSLFVSVPDVQ